MGRCSQSFDKTDKHEALFVSFYQSFYEIKKSVHTNDYVDDLKIYNTVYKQHKLVSKATINHRGERC